jgi:hypothetical protein
MRLQSLSSRAGRIRVPCLGNFHLGTAVGGVEETDRGVDGTDQVAVDIPPGWGGLPVDDVLAELRRVDCHRAGVLGAIAVHEQVGEAPSRSPKSISALT